MASNSLVGNFWDIVSNYKSCRMKLHDIYICKPPVGTVVINKILFPDVVKHLGGKSYFTDDELKKLAGTPIINELLSLSKQGYVCITCESDFVACGTAGELFVISFDDLTRKYQALRDNAVINITPDVIRQRTNKDGTVDWMLVRSSHRYVTITSWAAIFVPTQKKVQVPTARGVVTTNVPGVTHGKGDFIVCECSKDGQINLNTRRIINGEIFAATYNNQGWQECVSVSTTNRTISLCPTLFVSTSSTESDTKEPKHVIALRDTFVKQIRSGNAISYNVSATPTIEAQFSEAFLENALKVLALSNDALISFSIVNAREYLTVVYTKSRKFAKIGLGEYLDTGEFYDSLGLSIEDEDDYEYFKAMVLMLSCLQPRGFLSNFKCPPMTTQDVESFRDFTGSAYERINSAMYENSLNKLNFKDWMSCKHMYDTLSICRLKGVRLFRGMGLPYIPKVGQTIPLGSFTSWSLSFDVTHSFDSEMKFMFKATKAIEAVYINSLSQFRDSEFEVILNAGYKLKVRECIEFENSKLFVCELFEDDDIRYKLHGAFDRESYESEESFAEALANRVLANQSVGSILYLSASGVKEKVRCENIFANKYGNSDNTHDLVTVRFDFTGHEISISYYIEKKKNVVKVQYKQFQQAIDDTMQQLEEIVKQLSRKFTGSIYFAGQKFMFNIASRFESEGFQIIRQSFDAKKDVKDALHGVVVINGDNDDNIALRFRVTSDMKIAVIAQSRNIKLRHEFDANDDNLYDNIYNTVVHRFKLSQWRRIDRAFNLVARYKNVGVKVLSKESNTAIYFVGDSQFKVVCDGNQVIFSHAYPLQFNYFSNLRDMASGIAEQL